MASGLRCFDEDDGFQGFMLSVSVSVTVKVTWRGPCVWARVYAPMNDATATANGLASAVSDQQTTNLGIRVWRVVTAGGPTPTPSC